MILCHRIFGKGGCTDELDAQNLHVYVRLQKAGLFAVRLPGLKTPK